MTVDKRWRQVDRGLAGGDTQQQIDMKQSYLNVMVTEGLEGGRWNEDEKERMGKVKYPSIYYSCCYFFSLLIAVKPVGSRTHE